MKWEKVKLGDICKSIADGDHQAPKKQESGIPFITISNIDSNNRIDFTNCLYVSEEYYDAINDKRKASKDDILYSVVGSFGVPVLIKENLKFAFQRHIAILRPDTEKIFPAFMYYCILARDFYLQADSVAIGSAQRTITLGALNNMQLSLPPLPVQQRIASILSAYDDLIENNQKQINLLEEAAQRLYKEWFVDLRFPGHENVKIVDGVPEGWSSGQLIKLAEFKRGKTITKSSVKEGNVPVIAGGLEPAYFHNVANTVAPVITVSASGANAGYTALHNHNVWASDCSFVDSRNCEHIYYVYNFLKTNKNMMLNLQKGSAQPHVYAKNINELILLIPKEKVLKEYSDKVEVIYKAIFHKNKQISSLREARDRLLPKLMSGEIEV